MSELWTLLDRSLGHASPEDPEVHDAVVHLLRCVKSRTGALKVTSRLRSTPAGLECWVYPIYWLVAEDGVE